MPPPIDDWIERLARTITLETTYSDEKQRCEDGFNELEYAEPAVLDSAIHAGSSPRTCPDSTPSRCFLRGGTLLLKMSSGSR